MQFIKSNWLLFAGIAVGAIGGYLYWKFVGCQTGSCPITSSPLYSSIWGAVLGGLLFSAFKKEEKKK